jgi:CRISPR-associated protein Csc1
MAQHVPRQADSVHIRRGLLTLHDSLFFASREMGRLYETEPCIHNYALTYALRLAESPYFEPVQEPHYRADLKPLGG